MAKTGLSPDQKLTLALYERRDLASTEAELRQLSGVRGAQFKEALIRLEEVGEVFKWKSEKKVNYLVLREFRRTAYYLEPMTLPEIYCAFGHSTTAVMVKRTVPFIVLPDTELRKYKRNRYLEQIAEVA